MKPTQLKPQDVLFIGGEAANVYQHTAGLVMLHPGKRTEFDFEQLRSAMGSRLAQIPQYRWRLHEVPLELDLPYWIEDEHFCLDNHFHRIALPAPGDHQALAEVASYLYCKHLDRSRPLWETWYIEGLADGGCALLVKQHHCMMDGEGASSLFDVLFEHTPDAAPPAIDPSLTGVRAGPKPAPWQESLNTALHLYGLPFKIGREVAELASNAIKNRFTRAHPPRDKAPVPPTFFNADIGRDRGLVYGSLSLADIKRTKDHFGVTVNEVILAIVSSSLRDYLLARDALPAESLRTFIAVSLREEQDDTFSNKVTTQGVTLATDIDDPVERLKAIAEETEQAKAAAHHGDKGMMEFVQLMPPALVHLLNGLLPGDRIAEMMGANVIVSSVRGSDQSLYLGGARVEAVYPMSVLTPGGGINITCVSYAGEVHFGITIDPELVPEPWTLIDGLRDSLQVYTALCRRRRRRS